MAMHQAAWSRGALLLGLGVLAAGGCTSRDRTRLEGLIESFTADPQSGPAPLAVAFSWDVGFSSSDPLALTQSQVCELDFGDGTSQDVTPCPLTGTTSHTYTAPGTYVAKLTATDTYPVSFEEVAVDFDDAEVTVQVLTNQPVTLTVTIESPNDGQGAVASTPAGIACSNNGTGDDCAEDYPPNTTVGLMAAPAAGSQFDGWQGDCTGMGSCSVVMNGDKAVTASFSKIPAPGSTVSVSIRDDAGNPVSAAAVALQIGSGGTWTPVPNPGTQFSFDVPPGDSLYGVAVRCGMRMQTFHLTTEETTDLRVSCPDPAPPLVNYSIGWTGMDNIRIGTTYTTWHYNLRGFGIPGSGASGGMTLPNQPGLRQDLAQLAMVDGAVVGARIIRDVTPAAGSSFSFPFTAADRGDSALVSPFTVPSGGTGNFTMNFTTAGGLTIPLGTGTAAGGPYYTLPYAAGSGDAYAAFGIGFAPGGSRYATNAVVISQGMTVDLMLPPTWDDFVPPTPADEFTLTNLNSALTNHRGFGIGLAFQGAKAGFSHNAFVSCGWLGTNTTYTVPNPAGLAGFEEFVLTSGDNLSYTAESVFANLTVGQMLGVRLAFGIPVLAGLSRQASGASGAFSVP